MWTWSISASGVKSDVLAALAEHKPAEELDSESKLRFSQALDDAVIAVNHYADGELCSVSVSGNATEHKPTILQVVRKGPQLDADQLISTLKRNPKALEALCSLLGLEPKKES